MSRGIYIIGTDTEAGKTVVCAGLMYLLAEKGINAAYYKPVASGEMLRNGRMVPGDAAFVCHVSGFDLEMKRISPFSFADAVAPHLAARHAGRRITPDRIREGLDFLKARYDVVVAEAAGGLAVPLDDNGYMQQELIREMGFSCLLVTRAGLGTINHTILTLGFAETAGLKVKGIIVNRAAETTIEQDNILMIKKLAAGRPVFVVPTMTGVDTERLLAGNIREVFHQSIPIDDILRLMETI